MGQPTFEARYQSSNRKGWASVSSFNMEVLFPEYIGKQSKPGEVKHLSTRRKGHQPRLP